MRVANKKIGDITKEIKFPLVISEGIEITRISADSFLYGEGTGTVSWKASISNKSQKEVQSEINVCSSGATTMKIVEINQYYLVECEPIKIKYNPSAVSTNPIQFATTTPWTSVGGNMARLCIRDVGCVEKYLRVSQ